MNQRQAAYEAMKEWLSHPQELGKAPAKLEAAGEFDLHELHYYIFKYKKSMLGPWLVGVCGGYEGDETEHCGHVFSEMEPYDKATAEEKCIAMVEMIRAYMMEQARKIEAQEDENEDEEEENDGLYGPFAGFVLLSSPFWNTEQFKEQLKADWNIDYPPEDGVQAAKATEDGPATLVFDVDGLTVAATLMEFPVPEGEAEYHAHSNFMWPGAVDAAKAHVAHVMLAVLGKEQDPKKTGELYVKVVATCLKANNALGVYTNGTVLEPDYFIRVSEDLKDGDFPLLDLVFVGLFQSDKGVCGYTNGLRAFGKDELEIVDSREHPKDIHMLLLNVAGYVVDQDVTLRDGETLGYTAEQKLPITRSEGVNVPGMSLKIRF